MLLMKEGEKHFDQTIIDAFLNFYYKTYPPEINVYYDPLEDDNNYIACNQ